MRPLFRFYWPAKPEAATKNLLSALKDTDKGYRNAALNFASGFADQNVYIRGRRNTC